MRELTSRQTEFWRLNTHYLFPHFIHSFQINEKTSCLGLAADICNLLILSISFVYLLTQHMVTFSNLRVRNLSENKKTYIMQSHGISSERFLQQDN